MSEVDITYNCTKCTITITPEKIIDYSTPDIIIPEVEEGTKSIKISINIVYRNMPCHMLTLDISNLATDTLDSLEFCRNDSIENAIGDDPNPRFYRYFAKSKKSFPNVKMLRIWYAVVDMNCYYFPNLKSLHIYRIRGHEVKNLSDSIESFYLKNIIGWIEAKLPIELKTLSITELCICPGKIRDLPNLTRLCGKFAGSYDHLEVLPKYEKIKFLQNCDKLNLSKYDRLCIANRFEVWEKQRHIGFLWDEIIDLYIDKLQHIETLSIGKDIELDIKKFKSVNKLVIKSEARLTGLDQITMLYLDKESYGFHLNDFENLEELDLRSINSESELIRMGLFTSNKCFTIANISNYIIPFSYRIPDGITFADDISFDKEDNLQKPIYSIRKKSAKSKVKN